MPVQLAVDTSSLGNYVIVDDLASLPTGAARYPGVQAYQANTGQVKQWDGTGWVIRFEPAQPWTAPTFSSGFLAGNGVWTQNYYHRTDGYCEISGVFTWGSTTSYPSGVINLTFPVSALSTGPADFAVEYGDSSAGIFFRSPTQTAQLTAAAMNGLALNPTYIGMGGVSPTAPFTWAVNDTLKISGRYRMATRYL